MGALQLALRLLLAFRDLRLSCKPFFKMMKPRQADTGPRETGGGGSSVALRVDPFARMATKAGAPRRPLLFPQPWGRRREREGGMRPSGSQAAKVGCRENGALEMTTKR